MTLATATQETVQAQYKEIWSQLIHGRNKMIVMCWGTETKMLVGGADEQERAFLMFKVNARYFKGKVRIILEHDDTYTVEYWTMRRKAGVLEGKLVHTDVQVYADNLVAVIDAYVETH